MSNRNSTVPREMPPIAIVYKYNACKVISLITTEEAGITKDGFTYLSKYPDPFAKVLIWPVDIPLSCLSYFYFLLRLNPTTNPDIII